MTITVADETLIDEAIDDSDGHTVYRKAVTVANRETLGAYHRLRLWRNTQRYDGEDEELGS